MTLLAIALHTVGINVDTRAQVRLTSTAQERIVGKSGIRLPRRLQITTHLMYYASSGADADTLHALRLPRHHP